MVDNLPIFLLGSSEAQILQGPNGHARQAIVVFIVVELRLVVIVIGAAAATTTAELAVEETVVGFDAGKIVGAGLDRGCRVT
ncbi:hypothetical protein CH063_13349 [Colletotrichum higginsianum]|uniref:Uncharacterized protein n=1 Tax=Colletotrichum higginsianum (strain IMI 349063) TaxID=759273 RepID=H1VU17_COLHI|nr:hypothetical protein CH063_13349 [Colletotrichum higginsianum]